MLPRVVCRIFFCVLPANFILAACTSNASRGAPHVEYQLVIPHNAESYEEDENQTFLLGERIGVPNLPIYPPSLISQHLPKQEVCIEFDIDETGHVFESRPLYGASASDDCPLEGQRSDDQFYFAAKQAVMQWTFQPARICTYPTEVKAAHRCDGPGVEIENIPVRLAYAFSFEIGKSGPKTDSRTLSSPRHGLGGVESR